jgi:hypothetical protein
MTAMEDLEPVEDPYKACRAAVNYCEEFLEPAGYFKARRAQNCSAEQVGCLIMLQAELAYWEAEQARNAAVAAFQANLAKQTKHSSFLHYVKAKLGEL